MATKEIKGIQVMAIKKGFYGSKIREEDKKFTLRPLETQELTDKQFSDSWMVKV